MTTTTKPSRVETLKRDFQTLKRQGLHPFPVGLDKKPIQRWKNGPINYVEQMPSDQDGERWAEDGRTQGWAVLCGNRKNKVFTLDVERAGMDQPEMMVAFHKLPATCQRPSVSGGQHAVIVITDGEPLETGNLATVNGVLLAEIRGVGREGSAGAYAVVSGPGRGDLPTDFQPARMTRTEVDELLAPIRALNQPTRDEQNQSEGRGTKTGGTGQGGGTGALIADAILNGSLRWTQVLDDGWTEVSNRRERIGLLRPTRGQAPTSDESANAVGAVLTIWSTSVPWANPGEAFNPAKALAASRFGGDYAKAMRAVEQGARDLVTNDGTAPAWLQQWPGTLLEQIHAERETRDPWLDQFGPLNAFEPSTDDAGSGPGPSKLEEQIFSATPVLQYLLQLARARMVSPYALLGSIVALVLAETPPSLRIPPYIGAPASLNSYFAIVGPSGSGKTVGMDVASEILPPLVVSLRTPSSGEGIITLFVDVEKGEQIQHTQQVLSVVDEIGTLGAQQDRQGSTLASIMRSAWSGSTLSTNGADRTRRRHLLSHSYRYCMVMGVQPSTAHVLLDDQGAGTPQRIIWLPATDRHAPDFDVEVPAVNPLAKWRRPAFASEITFPDHVSDLVRRVRRDALRGTVNELDGHALLAREKLAAGLAILHGTSTVSDALWDVSGHLMTVSERTRQSLLDYRIKEARNRAHSQGRADAEREAAKTSHGLEHAVLVLSRYVHRNPSGVTRRQLKDACGRWKSLSTEAITEAVARGLIREDKVDHPNGQQTGTRYLPGKVKP
jgi:hypothetical protein